MKGFVSSRLHPAVNLVLLLVVAFVMFCLSSLLIAICSNLFFHVGLQEMGNVQQAPQSYPNGWGIMMLSQGLLLLGGVGGAAVVLAALTGHKLTDYFAPRRPVPLWWALVAMALIIISLPFMSGLIDWNTHAHFPAFMHDWEVKAKAMEDKAQVITRFLTRFTSPTRFLVAVLVVAVVPAVSEELFFRGVVQRNLVQWFNSRHVGIWLAAAIFSAIHFQFFGFVPRFVLGLVLGYLYEWSGNILVPMAAHFTQNAFQLVLLYVQQRQWSTTAFDPDSTDALPWPLMLLSLVVCVGLLWLLRRNMQAPRADELPSHMHTLSSGGVAVAGPEVPTKARTLSHHGVDITRENK
ncbi:CPBP family intramembrane glutamic endopeptidase [Hymenobacter wooponensis]|uniref:CPBP family intramembrane metalloprotease n=1 Tax=Hymenobacter wooponensis TaxID=1525360 RepID=A0A4Z0MGA7_9BACT|nr:CPBP family intramembrane glutamic endopeptidase [Hymenobacter wooponensis]TGD78564.1 CPBP family intramembrane metalloprotease [Hymenobacter wooponensis]